MVSHRLTITSLKFLALLLGLERETTGYKGGLVAEGVLAVQLEEQYLLIYSFAPSSPNFSASPRL